MPLWAEDPSNQVYRIKRSGEAAPASPAAPGLGQIGVSVKETPAPTPTPDPGNSEAAAFYHWSHSESKVSRAGVKLPEPTSYIDHGVLADVFKKFVTKSGRVDYRGLQRDKRRRKLLSDYVRDLSAIDPNTLEDPSDRIASWLNLYNAMVIEEILKHYPIKSLMQVKNYFGSPKYKIGNETYSLLDIEQKVFKEQIADPRTLFARVNGAASGPRLSQVPFHPLKLEKQLDERAWKFLADRANVDYNPKLRMLILNPVFLWYQEEFADLPAFLHTYLDLLPKYYSVSFTAYDWRLNDEKLH